MARSGCRFGLPLFSTAHWPAGHWMIRLVEPPLPYCAAVTPVLAHWAKVAVAGAPFSGAQGSTPTWLVLVTVAGLNRSTMFGARMARWNDARKRMSDTGAHCRPTL